MKFKNQPFLLILFAISVFLVIFSVRYLKSSVLRASLPEAAFMNASWSMPPEEVAAANHTQLIQPNTNKRFFSSKAGEENRYKVLMSQGQVFLGREADIYYTFKDNKLCMYHIFISDSDEERLDKDMRAYLNRKWGDQPDESQEEESTLKLLWQFKDTIINYWLFQDELSLAGHFKAGVGVTYRPLAES